MTQRKRVHPGLAASALALTIGFSSLGLAMEADARTVTGLVSDLAVTDIRADYLVDLTIKKAQPNPFDDTPAGQQPSTSLGGYTFTLQKVQGIDLSKPADWEKARTMTLEEAQAAGLGSPISATTNTNGEATFNGLEVGLYLVTEKPPHQGDKSEWIGDPFLLTLPTGSVDGQSWDYDVTVVAKSHPVIDESSLPPTTPKEPTTEPSTTRTVPPIIPGIPPGKSTTPTTAPTPATTTPAAPVPGGPGENSGQTPGSPTSPKRGGGLAQTGASVLGVVALGFALMMSGIVLLRYRRRESNT